MTTTSIAAGQTTAAAARTAAAETGTSTTATSSTTRSISSADFMTLLVTEMKNQDPTQPTDPNAYIQQLVGVNSLDQLIGINKTLTGALGSGTTGTGTNGSTI